MTIWDAMHINGTLDQQVRCTYTGERTALDSKGVLYGRTLYGLRANWVQHSLGGQTYYFSSAANAQSWLEGGDKRDPVLVIPLDRSARAATTIVAASTASDASKAVADYVCDGTDDNICRNNTGQRLFDKLEDNVPFRSS